MKHLSLDPRVILLFLVTACCWSCSDDDPSTNPGIDDENHGWGKTMAGNDPEEITWPDLCENYWEYTMDVENNPNVGIRFKGQFPNVDTRFFNITIYNDVTTKRIASVEDFNITPSDNGKNPFNEDGVTGAQYYEVNAIPDNAAAAVKSSLKNVMEFPAGTGRLCVLLRIYFNHTDHPADFGGVEKPEMVFFDTTTGKEIGPAVRAKSEYYEKFSGIIKMLPLLKSQKAMVFTLAPDLLYSNGPTGYVSSANRILPDSVLLFRFIPPFFPTHVAENRDANVRYWSICVGDTATYTRATLPDWSVKKSDDGYANFMLIEKSTPDYDKIVAKAESMKINVINWDNKTMGEGLMIFYRQMYIKKGFEYSVKNIPPYPPLKGGVPDQSAPITPENMAHVALGEHGPSGLKLPAAFVLSDAFSYQYMRIPTQK